MSKGKEPPGDYEIGKGRPPVSTRWKPGHSGNPNGRPKKRKKIPSFLEALAKRVEENVTITERGRQKSVPITEALAASTVARAFASVKEALHLEKLLQQLPADTESAAREQHEDGQRALQKIEAMIARRKEAERLGFIKADESEN